jgi:murein DD-endopeptidase MepM/ murein hydrolase activator NlpD
MFRPTLVQSRRHQWIIWVIALPFVFSALGTTDTVAQRSGISPEGREIIDNMSREERREFRSMSRRDRRAFIEDLLERRSKNTEKKDTPPTQNFKKLEGFVLPGTISPEIRTMVGKSRRGERDKAVEIQKKRGAIETGLKAKFIGGADCPEIDSEQWAIDYSYKRPWPALHKGVDIPQPRRTPIRAVAEGTVIGKFENQGNRKGIEIMLRHTPAETGLPFWTYSQYTHLLAMSPLPLGAKVAVGQEIGKTSNTGKMGRRIRRDALHFSIVYSARPEWSNNGKVIIPKASYWMDPNAFYRTSPPYDSQSLSKLPDDQKNVPVSYMKPDGSFVPPKTKRIWPYPCE